MRYTAGPVLFERLEGAALFIASTYVYFNVGFSWIAFVGLLFVFDVSMVGYLFGPRMGAVVYNIGHSLFLPSLLAIVYVLHASDSLLGLICLWFAHIGLDRALGYGLKYKDGFNHTHLGTIGKK